MPPPAVDGVYNPRFHHKTLLYQIIKDNLEEFLEVYPVRFEQEYGELRPEVESAFRKFLKCGSPEDGFAVFKCPDCNINLIVPFSCKNWICPSCSERRVIEWSMWLAEEVLYDIPHHFITLTMPASIRHYFFRNRWLIPYLERSIANMLSYYLKKHSEKEGAIPGIILIPQTFGERLNANIHFHVLCTSMCIDLETGGYYETHLPSFYELRQVWKNKVLSLLRNMKIISVKEYTRLRSYYSKGFHIHVSNPEQKEERDIEEELPGRMEILQSIGKYLVRTPLSEARILDYDEEKNRVTIRYKRYEFDHEGKLQKCREPGTETMDALELIARLSLHVPVPGKHKIRYYQAYSTRFRGEFKKYGYAPNETSENKSRIECKKSWRTLIHLIYQQDPLECPECGSALVLKDVIAPKDARRELKKLHINHLYYRYGKRIKKENLSLFDTS